MRIISLYVSWLTNDKHFTFMQFVLAATRQFSLVKDLFKVQVDTLKAAFDRENDIFLKHNRSFLTPAVQQAEEKRDKKFRMVYDLVKTMTRNGDSERAEAAAFLMRIIKDYGGIRIERMPVDAQSGALTNLAEDLIEKYADKVALLGLDEFVSEMQAANDEYIKLSADRTLDESQADKQAMVKARKETDDAYRGFVGSVNLYVKYNGDGELLPFIKFLNKEIERYRVQLGIGVGNADWGGDAVLPDGGDGETPENPETPTEPEKPADPEKPENPGGSSEDEDYWPENPDELGPDYDLRG